MRKRGLHRAVREDRRDVSSQVQKGKAVLPQGWHPKRVLKKQNLEGAIKPEEERFPH